MIKEIIQEFLKVIIRICYCIYNYVNIGGLYNRVKRKIYHYWVSNRFKSVGRDCIFRPFLMLREPYNISFGDNCSVGYHTVLELYSNYRGKQEFYPELSFGNNSSLGDYGHITCINKVSIGNNVRMGRKVFITDNAHGTSTKDLADVPPNYRPLFSKGPVIIEDNVWIGEMVCIMPGVTIGKCSIIGANAVVTKDVPPYSVVAGNPARILKTI